MLWILLPLSRFTKCFTMTKIAPYIVLAIFSSFILSNTFGQTKDTRESFLYVYGTYAIQIPGGDLSDDFGNGSDAGGGLGYKTKSGWMLGTEATYFFGNKVKNNTLEGLLNSDDQITTMFGEPGRIVMREAGYKIMGSVGKIFTGWGSNSNSGLLVRANAGFLQHKIYIESIGNNVPQVLGEYSKGYDRLCNGLMVGEFIGWQNFSNNGAYHFIIGFEFTQAFTANRRSWDFATNQKIDKQRLDLMYAIKLGYYIPLFRHRPSTGYFYY